MHRGNDSLPHHNLGPARQHPATYLHTLGGTEVCQAMNLKICVTCTVILPAAQPVAHIARHYKNPRPLSLQFPPTKLMCKLRAASPSILSRGCHTPTPFLPMVRALRRASLRRNFCCKLREHDPQLAMNRRLQMPALHWKPVSSAIWPAPDLHSQPCSHWYGPLH